MQLIPLAIGTLVAVGATKALSGGKAAAPIQSMPVATRDDAAAAVAAGDATARRRGSAADILNGVRGVEALSNTTGKLVLGN